MNYDCFVHAHVFEFCGRKIVAIDVEAVEQETPDLDIQYANLRSAMVENIETEMLQVPPEFRRKRQGQRMTLTLGLIITIALGTFLILLMTGCSAESIRQGNRPDLAPMPREAEREAIQQRGVEFCRTYPDDVACRKSK
jgi:hypothetical protein